MLFVSRVEIIVFLTFFLDFVTKSKKNLDNIMILF